MSIGGPIDAGRFIERLRQGVEEAFGDVIAHEVAVIGSHRVSIERIARSDGRDGSGIVFCGDGFGGFNAELRQSAALDKTSELVLREAIEIRAGINIGEHLGGRIGLGDGLDGRSDRHAVGSGERFDLRLELVRNTFGLGDPELDRVSIRIGGRRLRGRSRG